MMDSLQTFYPGINFSAAERLDPLLSRILGITAPNFTYVILQLVAIAIGSGALSWIFERSLARALLVATLTPLSVYFVVGGDPFFLKIHWFPTLVAVLMGFRLRPNLLNGFTMVIVGALWSLSAGSLAFFGAMVASVTTVLFAPRSGSRWANAFFAISVITLCVASVLSFPLEHGDVYSEEARVVPISPLTIQSAPLMGPTAEPVSLLYSAWVEITELSLIRFTSLVVVLGLLALIGTKNNRRETAMVWCGLLLIAGVLFLEITINSGVTPFRMIRRLVPGIGLTDLPWLITPFAIALGFPLLCRRISVPLLSIAPVGLIGVLGMGLAPSLNVLFPGMSPIVLEHHSTVSPEKWEEHIGLSRSAFVVQTFGSWVTDPKLRDERRERNLVRLEAGKDFQWQAEASVSNEEVPLALDMKKSTRWRTHRPQQPGDWFTVRFDRQLPVVKIILVLPKEGEADFARGLRVEVTRDGKSFESVVDVPNWQGAVQWDENGYPYFGPQSKVEIDFPKQETVQAVRFVQTSVSDRFDWSIGKIKLYRLP